MELRGDPEGAERGLGDCFCMDIGCRIRKRAAGDEYDAEISRKGREGRGSGRRRNYNGKMAVSAAHSGAAASRCEM